MSLANEAIFYLNQYVCANTVGCKIGFNSVKHFTNECGMSLVIIRPALMTEKRSHMTVRLHTRDRYCVTLDANSNLGTNILGPGLLMIKMIARNKTNSNHLLELTEQSYP